MAAGMRRLLEAASCWAKTGIPLPASFLKGVLMATAAQCVQPPSACSSTKTSLGFGKKPAAALRSRIGIRSESRRQTATSALATRGEAGDKDAFFGELYHRATQDEYQWLLRTAWKLTERDSLALLGSGLEAHRSVVTASACFAIAPNSYEKTIARAMALGNDTDTVMGMAGAISGAHLGVGAIPEKLIGMLEHGPLGVEGVITMATRLHEKRFQGG